jgi:formylmethanofuran dehydrogenase subunit E
MITPFSPPPRRCSECGRPAGTYTHPFTGDPLCILCDGIPPPEGPPVIAQIGRCESCGRLAPLYIAGDDLGNPLFCRSCMGWEALT